jgi:hypothetical protein
VPTRNVRRSINGSSRRCSAIQAREDAGRGATGSGPCRSPPYRLGGSLTDLETLGEISPHFRPAQWERDRLRETRAHPVRITGQLFFDAAHTVSPKRISLWEIHPVYGIDVCINGTIASCPAGNESKWMPLHQWVNTDEDEDE